VDDTTTYEAEKKGVEHTQRTLTSNERDTTDEAFINDGK
jgi:hypothetical protein